MSMEPLQKLVKVLQIFEVSPPLNSTAKTITLPLTYFDLPLLLTSHPQQLLFYKFPSLQTQHFMTTFLPPIKHSLSLTLKHYYPLAGNLTWPPQSCKPAILYVQGADSLPLTVAESMNHNFDLLSSSHASRHPNEFHPLIPQLPTYQDRVSVMAIQITLFPNHGISIGITTHHAAIDGRTLIMFLKAWALFNKLSYKTTLINISDISLPFFDRSELIKDPNGFEELYLQKLSQLMDSKSLSKHDCNNWVFASQSLTSLENPVAATFTLSRSDIATLKQKWASKVAQSKMDEETISKVLASTTPSSFVLVCAYTWVCLTRATSTLNVDGAVVDMYFDDDHENVYLLNIVDFRARLDPPMPTSYFGNCIAGVKVSAKKCDIVGDDGIVVAVNSIMKEMEGLRDGFVRNLEERFEGMLSTDPNQVFVTAGATKFGFYALDFGWGKPKKVELPSIASTGSIYFAESGQDDGGVEISFVRGEKEMEAFRVLFVNGLQFLISFL